MKTKKFDCVEMKNQAASNVRKKLKGLTMSERLSFWKKRHKQMTRQQMNQKKSTPHKTEMKQIQTGVKYYIVLRSFYRTIFSPFLPALLTAAELD
ncbi:hypothetical protein DRN98_03895 [Methanosarcinales archaeon]|nr:MAG: hypothetical protein DRN98_03895 [Methanosarcinales archaeon]